MLSLLESWYPLLKKCKQALLTLSFLLGLIVIFVAVVESVAFSRSFYQEQFTRLHVEKNISTTLQDSLRMSDTLLEYLQDKRDDLHLLIEVNGQERAAFNQREIDHMYDVRELYRNTKKWQYLFGWIAGAIFIYMIFWQSNFLKKEIFASFLRAIAIISTICGAFVFIILVDFDAFWLQFHQLIFRNDLWLLDPRTDLLILLVPEAFFRAMVQQILWRFLSLLFVGAFLFWLVKRRNYE